MVVVVVVVVVLKIVLVYSSSSYYYYYYYYPSFTYRCDDGYYPKRPPRNYYSVNKRAYPSL